MINPKKRFVSILLTLCLVIGVPLFVFVLFLFWEETSFREVVYSNTASDSVTVTILKDKGLHIPQLDPKIYLDSVGVPKCYEVDEVTPCIGVETDSSYYSHYELRNLSPSTEYDVKWSDTLSGIISNDRSFSGTVLTSDIDETAPRISRIYGRVIGDDDLGIGDSLVIIENIDDSSQPTFSAITSSDGTYNITHNTTSLDNYLQEVSVFTDTGYSTKYTTASFYNQPVSDIVIYGSTDENLLSSLVSPAEAANSCIKDTDMGGIRIQCNDKIDWTHQLDTKNCPASEHQFRLGVIKHKSVTSFHKPDEVTLKLYDAVTKTYVADPVTGEDLVINNGGYVDTEVVDLELGKKYSIQAFEGTTECLNTTDNDPYVVFNTPAGSDTPTAPGGSGSSSTTIPAMTETANLCKKMGENFAIPYQVPVDKMERAVGLRMRWGEALITDLNDIGQYAQSVSNGKNTGLNMLLRICYKGSCKIENGNAYGEAILSTYNQLKDQGQLPQNGLFVHVGHNEPNNAEYRDPGQEAQFVADVLKVLDGAGVLSTKTDDIGIKAISPNLDMYIAGDGQWGGCSDGCDDPNPHPNYTAQTYVSLMLQNGDFASQVDKLYAWAVNDYLLERGEGNVVSDVNSFVSFVAGKNLPNNVIITELGKINTSMSWDVLANTIGALDAMNEVQAILLFNSLGSNQDGNFTYHSELWNDDGKISSLFSNCGAGNFEVPQEGSVDVTINGSWSGSGSTGSTSTGIGVTGVNGSTSGGPYGSSFNGNDPCLGGICVGSSYGDYSTAVGGMLNWHFEGGTANDGASELNVPQYWHAWYQNGCQGGSCGTYSCGSGPAFCRRPEYKPSTDYPNRQSDGGSTSAMWFTTYGTQNAGLYQHIDLGTGGTNEIEFRASGSSWSNSKKCDEDENGSCIETDGCACEIINKFIGRIGIDPDGGINPTSGSIIWTDWKQLPNVQPSDGSSFTDFSIMASTDSDKITVFIAANNEYPYGNSDAYWDGAELYINGNIAIGQVENSPGVGGGYSDDEQECTPGMAGGAHGEACWDSSIAGYESSNINADINANILGASSISLPGRGEYYIDSETFEIENRYLYNYSNEYVSLPVFQDRNGDGTHDSDEYLVPSTMDVSIEKVGEVIEYNLKPGISLISVPFYTEDFDEAVEILEQIKAQGGYATAIASYENSGANPGLQSVSQRSNQSYGEDYKLSPGDAMYLVVQKETTLRLRGQEYTNPVQAYMRQGWNLVAVKGSVVDMYASDLLNEVNTLPGVYATKVTLWDSEKGRFVSYIVTEDGSVYGEDFIITETDGVFLFVKEGVGYWTPGG